MNPESIDNGLSEDKYEKLGRRSQEEEQQQQQIEEQEQEQKEQEQEEQEEPSKTINVRLPFGILYYHNVIVQSYYIRA